MNNYETTYEDIKTNETETNVDTFAVYCDKMFTIEGMERFNSDSEI